MNDVSICMSRHDDDDDDDDDDDGGSDISTYKCDSGSSSCVHSTSVVSARLSLTLAINSHCLLPI